MPTPNTAQSLKMTTVSAALMTFACGGRIVSPGHGSVLLGVSTNALSQEDVTRVTVTVSGPGIAPDIVQDLTMTSGRWTGIVGGIPAGVDRVFRARAFDASGIEIYAGERTEQEIVTGEQAFVVILLHQVNPPSPFRNTVPYIDSVSASANAVAPKESVELTAVAHDVDADDVLS